MERLSIINFFLNFLFKLKNKTFQNCFHNIFFIKIRSRCHINVNHIVFVQMSFKIFFLSNFVRSKEFPGITSKTVISINHFCCLGLSKTTGVGEGDAAGFCIKQFVRFRKKHCLININLTFYNFLKTFVSRIKISSHFSPRFLCCHKMAQVPVRCINNNITIL